MNRSGVQGGEWDSRGKDARIWDTYGTGNRDGRSRLGRYARFGYGGGETTPSVGDVLAYGEEYEGRSEWGGGYQNGGSDIFWDIQMFYGRNVGLESDLCGMAQSNIGLVVLQGKKSLGVLHSGVGGWWCWTFQANTAEVWQSYTGSFCNLRLMRISSTFRTLSASSWRWGTSAS